MGWTTLASKYAALLMTSANPTNLNYTPIPMDTDSAPAKVELAQAQVALNCHGADFPGAGRLRVYAGKPEQKVVDISKQVCPSGKAWVIAGRGRGVSGGSDSDTPVDRQCGCGPQIGGMSEKPLQLNR
jgi:hypothetical protein